MPDPLQRPGEDAPLFAWSTSRLAGEKAALASRGRRARILELLRIHGPQTLFELAAKMNVHDHQISGRITDLRKDGLIVPTGERRRKPETDCEAEVYALRESPLPTADCPPPTERNP